MASLDPLNTYLASKSYLGGNAATLYDYGCCAEMRETEIDPVRFPHLKRWYVHISYLLARYGSACDHLGQLVSAGAAPDLTGNTSKQAARNSSTSMQSTAGSMHFCVLDFEKTCEKDVQLAPQEIIEFPSVLIAEGATDSVAQFESYVRPTTHPTLTAFCTELTGITQQQVDVASPLPEVLARHHSWLRQHVPEEEKCVFVTCGDMDLKRSLPEDPNVPCDVPDCYRKWVNIKKAFGSFYTQWYKKGKQPRNMLEMLERLEISLEGQHHSGIDDCRNIAKVLDRMLSDGWHHQ